MVKFCNPNKNTLHFVTDQATANNSNLIVAYRVSVGVRKREPACIRSHFPAFDCCCRIKSTPCRLASVHRRVGLSASKNARVGAPVKCALALFNATSCSIDRTYSFFVLNNAIRVLLWCQCWMTIGLLGHKMSIIQVG